jgi:DNA-binding NarL/FixJ family response regulator
MVQDSGTQRQRLTRRERDVSRLLCRGCSAKIIAAELGVSVHTVRRHMEHIYKKLDAQCRIVAVFRILEGEQIGASMQN